MAKSVTKWQSDDGEEYMTEQEATNADRRHGLREGLKKLARNALQDRVKSLDVPSYERERTVQLLTTFVQWNEVPLRNLLNAAMMPQQTGAGPELVRQ